MTTPERLLMRRRLQHSLETSHDKQILRVPQSKDAWVKSFVLRLSMLVHNIGRKKSS
jgi:hypothetical protein